MLKLKVLSSGSYGNCYLLSTEHETLIIDCGVPVMDIKKALDFNISRIAGVIVSHEHTDHAKSLDKLRNMGISTAAFYQIQNWDDERMKYYRVRMGGFLIRPFPLPHNGVTNYGFLIEADGQKILYLTDFEYCRYTFKNLKVNHILVECNYQQEYVDLDLPNYEHKVRGHCSLKTCKEFVRINTTGSLRTVLLLHMGQGTCEPEECVTEVQKVAGEYVYVDYASRGLEVDLRLCPF